MPSFNSVLRRYTPPTCTLEIQGKTSPLSKWTGKPAVQQLTFKLSFDAPQLPQEKQVTIRGDGQTLDELYQAVTTYVQDFVKQSPPRLNASYLVSEPDSAFSVWDTQTKDSELKTKLQSQTEVMGENGTTLPSPPDAAASEDGAGGIRLQPRGLVSHDLYLGPLATPQSGSVINLGTLQLFDLATALDSYGADLLALPNWEPEKPGKSPASWWKVAAIALFTAGVSASVLKLLSPPLMESNVATSTQEELTAVSPPPAPAPPPPSPPAESNSPLAPTPSTPTAESVTPPSPTPTPQSAQPQSEASESPSEVNQQRRSQPQSEASESPSEANQQRRSQSASTATAPPTVPPPPPTTVPPVPPPLSSNTTPPPLPEMGDRPTTAPPIPDPPEEVRTEFEIIPADPSTTAPPIPSPPPVMPPLDANPPSELDAPISAAPRTPPMPTSDIPVPSIGSDEPPPVPILDIEPSPEILEPEDLISTAEGIDVTGLKAPPTEMSGDAQERETPAAAIAPEPSAPARETDALFNEPPQLAQAKAYFQENWQPPPDFEETLQYILHLNPDGSIERIVPLGVASKMQIELSGVPLNGKPFVSSLPDGETLRIRVVLEPEGRVQTFRE